LASLRDDSLDRALFVDRARELLEQVGRHPESTVVGLVGPWGSGKSSTVNMIEEGLDRPRWGVARVTPWGLSGPDQIVAELLAAVASCFKGERTGFDRARDAIAKYGTLATPLLSIIPFVGTAARGLSDAAVKRFLDQGTLAGQAKDVADQLERLARPVLVVVDDVDRLEPADLLALFKGVRLLGQLPYVHYLLAYDEETLLDVLATTPLAHGRADRALAFLEKIITLRLDQPPTREDQAQAIFDQCLFDLLAEIGVTLTEDQVARLADEREALLLTGITEPRSIARLFTQLRAYLPVVGPQEVDLVDFIVLTYLRVTFPMLYRAVSADQRLLVGAEIDFEDTLHREWPGPDALVRFAVPAPATARVYAALQRLFPQLSAEGTELHVLAAEQRRVDRRASDVDHVGRYFALVPASSDMTDSQLSAALTQWSDGVDGPESARLRELLTVPGGDEAQRRLPARVMRRASARAQTLPPAAAGRILAQLLGLLPLADGSAETGAAAGAWIGALLSRADSPEPAELLATLDVPDDQPSSLPVLVRALRQLAPGSASIWLTLDAVVEDSAWLADLVLSAQRAAWERFRANVRLGDAAPDEPVGALLRWVEEREGYDIVNRRLASLVDEGVEVAVLAARFVEVGIDQATDASVVVSFDVDGFIERLGRETVRDRRDELSEDADAESGNPDDATWSGRRKIAAHRLYRELIFDVAFPPRPLPELPVTTTPAALLNHRPSLLGAPTDERPDLYSQVTAVIPVSGPPLTYDTRAPLVGDELERAVLTVLESSSVGAWLNNAASTWGLEAAPWAIGLTDGSRHIAARCAPRSDAEGRSTWRQQTPLIVGGELRIPADGDGIAELLEPPAVIMTLGVGMWIIELDADRGPSGTRQQSTPLPAALSPRELFDLVTALANVGVATDALGDLSLGVRLSPGDSLLDFEFDAPSGLDAVVALPDLQKVPSAASRHYRRSVHLAARRSQGRRVTDQAARDLAAGLLNDWMLQAGIRGYEDMLRELWQAKALRG
jgi:hypothetical protein